MFERFPGRVARFPPSWVCCGVVNDHHIHVVYGVLVSTPRERPRGDNLDNVFGRGQLRPEHVTAPTRLPDVVDVRIDRLLQYVEPRVHAHLVTLLPAGALAPHLCPRYWQHFELPDA